MTKTKKGKCCVGCGEVATKHYKWMASDGWSYKVHVCGKCNTPHKLDEIRKKVKI